MNLKILSWNIWIDNHFKEVAEFLKSQDADIIGFQEVLPDDPKRDVVSLLENLGYNSVFSPFAKTWGEKVYCDAPAIFTKFKIQKSERYVLSKNESRIAVRAEINVGNELLHVFSTHLVHTHQKESEIQKEQVQNLIKKLPPTRTIVMGDFNATPESSVIKNMQKVMVDSDPASEPTWSMYPEGCPVCNPQKLNIRLDYIFTTKDLKTTSFKVENSKGSDHLPISVSLEL